MVSSMVVLNWLASTIGQRSCGVDAVVVGVVQDDHQASHWRQARCRPAIGGMSSHAKECERCV